MQRRVARPRSRSCPESNAPPPRSHDRALGRRTPRCTPRRPRRLRGASSALVSEPVAAGQLALDGRDPAGPRDGARLVLERRLVSEVSGPWAAVDPGTVNAVAGDADCQRPHRHGAPDARARPGLAPPAVAKAVDAASWEPAPPAAREGAHVALVSRSPLAQSASYWAQGGLAGAIADDDDVSLHVEDTLAAGRGTCAPTPCASSCEKLPLGCRNWSTWASPSTAPPGGARALARGRPQPAARRARRGSATGRRVTRDLSALVAVHQRIDVLERSTALALWLYGGAAWDVVAERPNGRSLRARARHRDRDRRGSRRWWSGRPTARRDRRRPRARARGRRRARGPGVHAVPPDGAPSMTDRPRRLPHHRGGARRGRAPPGRQRRALRRRARARDEVARRSPARQVPAGPCTRHARRGPGPVPERIADARARRTRPRRDPFRSPRSALHDRADRDGPGRALHPPRPLCGRRVRMHRCARGEPPGVELAFRMPGVRPARGNRRRGSVPVAPSDPGGPPERPPGRRSPLDARRALAVRGPLRDPAELATAPPRTRSAGALRSRGRRSSGEESRGAHQRVDHPETDPAP